MHSLTEMAKGYGRELFLVPQDCDTLSNSLLHAWSQLLPSHASEHDPFSLRQLVRNTLANDEYLERVWYTDRSTEKPTSYTLRATLSRVALQCGKEMSAWLESMRHAGEFGDEGFLIGFSIATKLAVHIINSCGVRTVRPPVEFGAEYLPQGGVWLAWERDVFCCSTISAACQGKPRNLYAHCASLATCTPCLVLMCVACKVTWMRSTCLVSRT